MDVVSGIAGCYSCGRSFTFCLECVTVVAVDPTTNRPPDVDTHGEVCTPDPDAMARTVARPLCVPCTTLANTVRPAGKQIETETTRHARHVGPVVASCRVIA